LLGGIHRSARALGRAGAVREPLRPGGEPPVQPQPTRWKRPTGTLDKRLRDRLPFDDDHLARMRANYAGKVNLIDDQVGEIIRTIELRGEADRTVLVFVSDHGEMNGDYGLIRKQTFLNGAVRVPFVVRVPRELGATEGAVRTAPVELMDLGATLAELAGARLSGPSKARSLVPALADPAASPRKDAISEIKHEAMLATADWKAAVNSAGEIYMLFDLRADPDERLNLAGKPDCAAVSEELRQSLVRRTASEAAAAHGSLRAIRRYARGLVRRLDRRRQHRGGSRRRGAGRDA
jgi:arylsulfatase